MIIQTGWKPSPRNVTYQEKPEHIPDWVYTEATAAKRFYNEQWEYWVWLVSQEYNVSQADAEVACIKGIKKEILKQYVVYGDQIGKWFEDFLDMNSIFSKVVLPTYKNKLGD